MALSPTLGSHALAQQLQRGGFDLRKQVQRHGQELATGETADPNRHLRGDLGALALVRTRLGRIEAESGSLSLAASTASLVQSALDRISVLGDSTRAGVMRAASGSATAPQIAAAGREARADLDRMVSALATQSAGRSVFAGNRVDQAPLPPATTILAEFGTRIAGLGDVDQILAAADAFFMEPGGGYAAVLYAGGPPVALGAAAPGRESDLPTALDPALRQMLRDTTLATLLDAPSVLPDPDQRQALALALASRTAESADALAGLRAQVGQIEAGLDAGLTRLSAERDALERRRGDLVGVDPFDAATRLEEARARLEALYVVTARVARLSLTDYLR